MAIGMGVAGPRSRRRRRTRSTAGASRRRAPRRWSPTTAWCSLAFSERQTVLWDPVPVLGAPEGSSMDPADPVHRRDAGRLPPTTTSSSCSATSAWRRSTSPPAGLRAGPSRRGRPPRPPSARTPRWPPTRVTVLLRRWWALRRRDRRHGHGPREWLPDERVHRPRVAGVGARLLLPQLMVSFHCSFHPLLFFPIHYHCRMVHRHPPFQVGLTPHRPRPLASGR